MALGLVMIVNVKFFGSIVPLLHKEEQEFELAEGATIKQLVDIIIYNTHDQGIQLIKSASFIVNKESANLETILKDKDNVLILYTLGGG
jgi:molybdopterin converting factor small subunit